MSDGQRLPAQRLLLFLILQQGLFLAIGVGLWIWSGRSATGLLRFGWLDLALGVALTALLVGLLASIAALAPRVRRHMTDIMARTLFMTDRPYGRAAILLISFAAGLGEEVLFRAGIQQLAADHMPGWAAIGLATLLFALAHPASRLLMAFVAGVSLILGIAYHLTGSLMAVLIAHALLDVWGCATIQKELRARGHWGGTRPALADERRE